MEDQRQRQAIELLRSGASVKETAAQLGYRQAHNFSQVFKERWGHCPTAVEGNMPEPPAGTKPVSHFSTI